ncbi:hypothetical protein HGRIS_013821 [Hohenbuehelia grisea]|uniref:Uncharacterized protein n=1 Tax=Hohenbuehelia grisea TaxID=104357 RepID=A0ABR3IWS7_9AGAR
MATLSSSPQPFFAPPYRAPDGSPSKRQRLSQGPSRSRANSVSAPVNEVDKAREASRMRLLDAWSQLAERYTKGLDEDDIIDLRTGTLVKDRGVLRNTPFIEFGDFVDSDSRSESLEEDVVDDDGEEEEGDELDCIQEGAATAAALQVPPVQEMDPADAKELQEFLEADQKLMGLGGDEDEDHEDDVVRQRVVRDGVEEEEEEEEEVEEEVFNVASRRMVSREEEEEEDLSSHHEGTPSVDPSLAEVGENGTEVLSESDDDLNPLNDLWDDPTPHRKLVEPPPSTPDALRKSAAVLDISDSDDEFGAWHIDEASSFRYVREPGAQQSPEHESNGDSDLQMLSTSHNSPSPSQYTPQPPPASPKAADNTPSSASSRRKHPQSSSKPANSRRLSELMPPPIRIPKPTNTQLHTPPRSHSFSSAPPDNFAVSLPTRDPSFSSPLPPSSPTPSLSVVPSSYPRKRGRPLSDKTLAARAKASADSPRAAAEPLKAVASAGEHDASPAPRLDLKQITSTFKGKSKPSRQNTPLSSDTMSLHSPTHPRLALSSSQKAKALRRAQTPAPPDLQSPSTSLKVDVRPPKHLQVEVVIPLFRKTTKLTTPKRRASPPPPSESVDVTPQVNKGKGKAIVIDLESSASEAEPPRNTNTRIASPTPPPKIHTVKSVVDLRSALKQRPVSCDVARSAAIFSPSRSPTPPPKSKKRRRSSGLPAHDPASAESVGIERGISPVAGRNRPTQVQSLSPSKRPEKARHPHRRPPLESQSKSTSIRSSPMRTRSRSRSRPRDPSSDFEYRNAHEYEPSSMYESYPPTSSSVPVTPRRQHHHLALAEPARVPGHRYATPVDDPRVQSILSYAMTQISYLWAHDDPPPHASLPMPMPMHEPPRVSAWPPFAPTHHSAWPPGRGRTPGPSTSASSLPSAIFMAQTPTHNGNHPYPYSYDPAFSRGTLPPSSPPVTSSPASSSPVRPRRRRGSVSLGVGRARSASQGRKVSFVDDEEEEEHQGGREVDTATPVRGRSKGGDDVDELDRRRGRSTSVRRK